MALNSLIDFVLSKKDIKCFSTLNVIFIITNDSCKTENDLAMTYRVSLVVKFEQKYDIP